MSNAPTQLRFVVASDHAGYALKEQVEAQLKALGHRVEDLGPHGTDSVDYPDYAHALATVIVEGRADRGVLVCGSGIGMSMAANRHAGIRAALCTDSYMARMTRMHNDANVLCMGARITGAGVAEDIVSVFASTGFEGGRHAGRVGKIDCG